MPPDISTGPMAATGAGPGFASGPTAAGPPGSDPIAALFAAFLAQSAGPSPAGVAVTMPKIAPKPETPAGADGKTTQDKTPDKTLSAAPPTLPPLPIQMRPTLPPTAGVPVGQKTAGKKTMDTSPAPASPLKEKAGTKPGGELPLQDARSDASGAPALPAFFIPSPITTTPIIAAPTPPVGPAAGSLATAAPVVPTPGAAMTALPVVTASLQGTAAAQPSEVFGASAVSAAVPAAATPSPPTAEDVPPPVMVPVAAVLKPTEPPVGEPAAADPPATTPPADAGGTEQALPHGAQVLVPSLLQATSAVAVQVATPGEVQPRLLPRTTPGAPAAAKAPAAAPLSPGVAATEGFTVTDGKAATEGRSATDGEAARDGTKATDGGAAREGRIITEDKSATDGVNTTDGRAATDGQAATDGKLATEGKTLTAGGAPEKGLKSAAQNADTSTRGQAVPAKTLPADLGPQVTGKRAGRDAESIGSDAPPVPPTPLPAQAEAGRTEAKPIPAADRAEMVRQVADAVGAMPLPAKPGEAEQMTLQLHPKDWGQLQVSVRITPGSHPNAVQAVTAHIVAETPQVKAALENGSGDLRQALRAAGLHLDRISVTVQRMDASAQAGTATSGGRHEANHGGAGQGTGGAFGETTPDRKTGMSSGTGMSGASGSGLPFAASGGSHGGRQGGQPPAYAAAYAPAEAEDASLPEAPRRGATGGVDIRA